MKIGGDGAYLALHTDANTDTQSTELLSSLPDALKVWRAGTRISPVWPASDYKPVGAISSGTYELLFLGPVEPSRALGNSGFFHHAATHSVWVSAGMLNLIVGSNAPGGKPVADLIAWAKKGYLAHEHWLIEDGIIQTATSWLPSQIDCKPVLEKIATEFHNNKNPAAETALQEFYVLLASALTRAATLSPSAYANVENIAQTFCAIIEKYAVKEPSTAELLHNLVSMNAALSRFTSQAFSGTPQIAATECHFWVHSLLGTGSANLALDRLAEWVNRTLGSANLPERIKQLERKTDGMLPTYDAVNMGDTLMKLDIVRDLVPMLPADVEPPSAIVTFFSGRDGYHGDTQTLSAPLASIAECNAHRSSLITITHEISHLIMEGVMGYVFPDMYLEVERERWKEVIYKNVKPKNYREALSHILFMTVMVVENAKYSKEPDHGQQVGAFLDIFSRRRDEARELLVHAFDFLYFYQGDPALYLEGIWQTWSSIPKLRNKIDGYVMRSLCTVSAANLNPNVSTQLQEAVQVVRSVLQRLAMKPDFNKVYVEEALKHLDKNMAPDKIGVYEKYYFARMGYVRFVRAFLYSESLEKQLFDDPFTSKGPYMDRKNWLLYDHHPVGNPIKFIRSRLKDDTTPATSLWVLHNIAFAEPPK